ncbi:class I SAM-dependent methyltransferase [Streptomyces cyaneofuscatus]|uniref:class I SAM-dependent methyltransferase n=1 Tax=Streptomyces TaxID=1883 RepID=UPI00036B3324|nr:MULTISPECIES: SAM-dependent methyltransferase [unclassified Streptomyces]MZF54397.1 methyltransferase domain-containing protein [Streptomyces sp. SID5594]PVC83556.1 methyltransferase domain-containing protein [Streptomyces sp. CS090A]
MSRPSTPATYFDAMYGSAEDPWSLTERWYERRKYDLTVAALPLPRYRRAFEPGCSVGELTRRLADRCDTVLACDRVESAVGTARRRTAALPNVSVHRMLLPEEWPEGSFDLIVLSELLYYLDEMTLDTVLERTVSSLEPEGTLVTVHWNHPVEEHLTTGDGIAKRVAAQPGLVLAADHREEDFVLQVHRRTTAEGSRPAGVAAREGLV